MSYNYDRVREVINKGCLKVLYLLGFEKRGSSYSDILI